VTSVRLSIVFQLHDPFLSFAGSLSAFRLFRDFHLLEARLIFLLLIRGMVTGRG